MLTGVALWRKGVVGSRLNAIAGVFVAISEGELGDAGLVELAEAFGDHSVVLFQSFSKS